MPNFVFKIYYAVHQGSYYSFALKMENAEYHNLAATSLLEHETHIEHIEELTGFEFPQALKAPNVQHLCHKFDCKSKVLGFDRANPHYQPHRDSVCVQHQSSDSDETDL